MDNIIKSYMKKSANIIIVLLFMTVGYAYGQGTNNNYAKGSRLVSAFPYGFGGILGNKNTDNEKFGLAVGHIFRYGYFIGDKSLLSIGSFQNYHYYTAPINGTDEHSHTTTSTLMFSYRYYFLDKRFSPYVDIGYENYFNYDDWEAWDGLKPKIYYVGSAYAAGGLAIPLGKKFQLNMAYRYLYPIVSNKNAEQYNRYGFSSGFHFFPGLSYTFKKEITLGK